MKSKRARRGTGEASPPQARKTRDTIVGIVLGALVLAGLLVAYFARPATSTPGVSFPGSLTRGSAQGFNVLLITLDTTRADHLGCYGYEGAETPVLDALAAKGVLFRDAVTVVPITLPAHTSMLTGLDPPNHGVRNNGQYRLAQEHVTLAEVLKGAGYETGAFVSAFVLDARYALNQGFDVYDDEVDPAASITVSYSIFERQAISVTDSALRWLHERDGSTPFFAWVHYFDPHQPLRPPEPYASRFPNRLYDGEIAYMDSQVGRLLHALDERGFEDRTLTVVVADHGEGLGDHGEPTHGILIYESTMHVPLIVSCPGVFRGPHVVDDVVVSVNDIFPTVIELLGIAGAPPCDGVSLLTAREHGDRIVYQETMMPYLDTGWAPLFGLRRHNDKYILAPRPEYYDLGVDPGELDNLYVNPPAGAVTARDALVAGLASMLAKWPSAEEVGHAALPVDPESIARLESLGYVRHDSPHAASGQLDPKDMMPVMVKINEARKLAQAGRHKRALATIKEAAAASPGNRSVLLQMGRICLAMKHEAEAEEALRKCITTGSGAHALTLLAQILIADGRFDEADQLLQQAVKIDPRHGAAFIAHGDFARAHGRFPEARASYLYAKQVDPYRSGLAVEDRLESLHKQMSRLQQP